jgi:hypothetical protein
MQGDQHFSAHRRTQIVQLWSKLAVTDAVFRHGGSVVGNRLALLRWRRGGADGGMSRFRRENARSRGQASGIASAGQQHPADPVRAVRAGKYPAGHRECRRDEEYQCAKSRHPEAGQQGYQCRAAGRPDYSANRIHLPTAFTTPPSAGLAPAIPCVAARRL